MTTLGSPYTHSQRLFRLALFSASRMVDPENVELLSNEVRSAFIKFGSETWDNLNCYSHIEYGGVAKQVGGRFTTVYGLKVKDTDILVSDISRLVEKLPLPEGIKHEYPDLTQSEWEACVRTVNLVLRALENHSESQHNMRYFKRAFSFQLFAVSNTVDESNVDILSLQLMDTYWRLWNEFRKFEAGINFQSDDIIPDHYIDYTISEPMETSENYGFRLKSKNISVSDIINAFESYPIPHEIYKTYPILNEPIINIPEPAMYERHRSMRQEEWDSLPAENKLTRWNAVTRIMTMVLLAFEREERDLKG